MGRSLSPIALAAVPGEDVADGRTLFVAQELGYSIEKRDGRVIHKEARRDASGRIVVQNEAEVQYVFGSGNQGFAYLIERDGFLFQSPISWYSRQGRWDLAPGYQNGNPHFDRPIMAECLFCHANQVEPVPGTANRYAQPIFRGHAIGCERCHGPGELHVARPPVTDGGDRTIVNPAELEPSLRDAVCEQCHLMGEKRVVKLDRREEDFRPGKPFDDIWSVFLRPDAEEGGRFVGQVEQMHVSRCYSGSRGRLGCISCHDPHERPEPRERVSYFRGRCLECHTDRGCGLPAAVRLQQSRDDDCTSCHMPRSQSADIVHAAATSHRILRHSGARSGSGTSGGSGAQGNRSLVLFRPEREGASQRAAAGRDLGMALCNIGPDLKEVAEALPLLETGLAVRPDDTAALESKGVALGRLGRFRDGLAAFHAALEQNPTRETALAGAASLAVSSRQFDEAIALVHRAIAISPWRFDYRAELASLHFQVRDWKAAADACSEALRLNPVDVRTRTLLVRCLLRLEKPEAARTELQTLLALDPPGREQLLQWFAPLVRPR
jgi:Flp pilus assembly protein TadD